MSDTSDHDGSGTAPPDAPDAAAPQTDAADAAEERRVAAVQDKHRRLSMGFRALPVIFALFLAGNVGLLYFLGQRGGEATGARVTMALAGTCGPEAAPMVQARADTIGLGDPKLDVQGDTLRLEVTLPGLADEQTTIPALMARRGLLEVRHDGQVLATHDDLTQPVMSMDESGMPFNDLAFTPEAIARLEGALERDPDGELVFVLDDEVLARRPNGIAIEDGTLKVVSGDGPTRERMRRVTDRHVVLLHGPLPCTLTVRSVEPVAATK